MQVPVLLRDNANRFGNVMLYGIERDLVLMDLMVFIMWDLVFQVCLRKQKRESERESVRMFPFCGTVVVWCLVVRECEPTPANLSQSARAYMAFITWDFLSQVYNWGSWVGGGGCFSPHIS